MWQLTNDLPYIWAGDNEGNVTPLLSSSFTLFFFPNKVGFTKKVQTQL